MENPDIRVFELIFQKIKISPDEGWIIGDNYEWEVKAPKSHGTKTIWHNYKKKLLKETDPKPDFEINHIGELLSKGILNKLTSP